MTVTQISSHSRRGEAKKRLDETTEAQQEYKRHKLDRTRHKGAGADVELVNIFTQLGLAQEFHKDKQQAFQLIPSRLEGRNRTLVPDKAWEFLVSDFGATAADDGLGRQFIHFPMKGENELNLLTEVAEVSGQKRIVVKEVYEAMRKCIRTALRTDRTVRLPDIGIIKVTFKPARPKKKGKNPFKPGETMIFKAKPASNKLKFRFAKKLRTFVDNKVPVKAPKKKK